MAKITYIEHTGTPHTIEVASGLSVMEELFRIIYQALTLIVEEVWLVLLVMSMSKKIGLINCEKRRWRRGYD